MRRPFVVYKGAYKAFPWNLKQIWNKNKISWPTKYNSIFYKVSSGWQLMKTVLLTEQNLVPYLEQVQRLWSMLCFWCFYWVITIRNFVQNYILILHVGCNNFICYILSFIFIVLSIIIRTSFKRIPIYFILSVS